MSNAVLNLDDPATRFSATLADAARTLTLGKALSNSSVALLAERHPEGLLLGEIGNGHSRQLLGASDGEAPGSNGSPYLDPSTVELHNAVFTARPNAGAVVLLRARRLAAWALSHRPLPVRYFQMFSYTRAQEIPVAAADPDAIGDVLAAHPDAPALLLDDGRTLIWAPQSARAIRLVLSLEEAAYVTSLADHLGGAKDYPLEAREKIYLSLQAQTRR